MEMSRNVDNRNEEDLQDFFISRRDSDIMEMSRNGDNRNEEDLQDFFISRRKSSSFTRGKLLSIVDISSTLIAGKSQLNDDGRKMLERLEQLKLHHFQHTQFPFPVSNLQHVTDLFSMYEIYKQDGFKATEMQSRPEFKDLSFWSASVSMEAIDGGRQWALENVKGLLSPEMAIMYEEKIREQFASSSAFNQSFSRYGNFKFSFLLSELMSLYQGCWPGEPELRILGTDIYKTEISHYILVHRSDATEFSDLPVVPSYDQNICGPLPFVYRKMGTLYWRPESTVSALKIKVTERGSVINECCLTCDFFITNGYCRHTEDGIPSVWNHLIFAFHLPGKLLLQVPKHRLLQNLTTCHTEEPYLGKERLEPEAAGRIIQRLKDDFIISRRQ